MNHCFKIVLLLLFSCSGYKIVKNENNFKKYGLKSISIPMFYNQSILPNVTGSFTNAFSRELNTIKNLEIKSPNSTNVDGYFVGIIRSSQTEKNVIKRGLSARIKDIAPLNAPLNENLVPLSNSLVLTLEIYLIRRNASSQSLISRIREKNHPELLNQHPSIILKRLIKIDTNFVREFYDGANSVVNATQYQGTLAKVVEREARKSAIDFKDSVRNVF